MKILILLVAMLCQICPVVARDEGRKGGDKAEGDGHGDPRSIFLSAIPPYPGNVMLSRPTDHSITANVMLNRAGRVRIVYGAEGKAEQQTEAFELKPGVTQEIVLDKLPPDAACRYRLVKADSSTMIPPDGCSGMFHTQRSPGSSFTFTIQADSHLDGSCLPVLYTLSLSNALASKPDFHVDLGDTFMTGKIATREEAARQYLAQRYYLGLIGHSAPVFMVIGNHDGEELGRGRREGEETLSVWSCQRRKTYFSNPVPDQFYSGDTVSNPQAGLLQDYYAWEWGSALFVVLDPYWYSRGNKGGAEPWNMTIGKTQYDWLARTLRQSRAKFKFVFIHQLVGGLDKGGRGGSEAASLFEWGGSEKDGTDTFAANRPGWEKPIHKLLVEAGVSVVFHGHDHFFARQELDGIVYQLVPQPAHSNFRTHQAEEYGYLKGEFLPNSGILSVTVAPGTATVGYVQSRQALNQQAGQSGFISYRYTITSK